MAGVPPVVRYMILCDEVLSDPQRPGKPIIVGLTTSVRPSTRPSYPFRLPRLCAFLLLTDGRGQGVGEVRSFADVTNQRIFAAPARTISFHGADPLGVQGVQFRMKGCTFPQPGVYRFEFVYDGVCLAQQYIRLR